MKKLLSILLCAVLVGVAGLGLSANAATEDIQIAVTKNGDAVTVEVKANAAFELNGLQVALSYDEEAFAPAGAESVLGQPTLGPRKVVAEKAETINAEAGQTILTVSFNTKDAYDETKDYTFGVTFEEAYAGVALDDLPFKGSSFRAVLAAAQDPGTNPPETNPPATQPATNPGGPGANTGETSPLLWVGLAAICGLAVMLLVVTRRKAED